MKAFGNLLILLVFLRCSELQKDYLNIHFKEKLIQESFERLEMDKEFASRHPLLLKQYQAMKKFRFKSLLGKIPPSLCTPMSFVLTYKNHRFNFK